MLSSNINEASNNGTSTEEVQEYERVLIQLAMVELGTDVIAQADNDQVVTEPNLSSSWDEIEAEWFKSGTEFMIF